jgi:hypothetical protein
MNELARSPWCVSDGSSRTQTRNADKSGQRLATRLIFRPSCVAIPTRSVRRQRCFVLISFLLKRPFHVGLGLGFTVSRPQNALFRVKQRF